MIVWAKRQKLYVKGKSMSDKQNNNGIVGNFSVALGLFDYINPVFYGITVITIIIKLFAAMSTSAYVIFLLGAVISIIFGLSIPTVKLIVGLGKMQFKMPVNLVSFVNTGILISGIALVSHVVEIKPLTLCIALVCAAGVIGFLWYKTGKFNTVAVLIGAVGYLMIYASLITLSIRNGVVLPIILYAFAICLFVFLCLVGILSNLKNAKVHWVIEISNVVCQFSVALATLILLW